MKFIVSIIVITVIFIGVGIWIPSPKSTPETSTQLDSFAKCLAEKNLTMYGAAWCSHCQAQKKLFGDSFQYVPYVECPNQAKLCLDKGVEGYPTWITQDGTKLVGEQSLQSLSSATSCPLP